MLGYFLSAGCCCYYYYYYYYYLLLEAIGVVGFESNRNQSKRRRETEGTLTEEVGGARPLKYHRFMWKHRQNGVKRKNKNIEKYRKKEKSFEKKRNNCNECNDLSVNDVDLDSSSSSGDQRGGILFLFVDVVIRF